MTQVQASEKDCLFCKIIAGDIPSKLVFQNERVTAFEDIAPQSPIHFLIISKTHTASHLDTEDAKIYQDLLQAAKDIATEKGLEHYRLVMNNGADAGQSVFHMHLHLLAGRAFRWPPG